MDVSSGSQNATMVSSNPNLMIVARRSQNQWQGPNKFWFLQLKNFNIPFGNETALIYSCFLFFIFLGSGYPNLIITCTMLNKLDQIKRVS